MKLYSVSDEYIAYLREKYPRMYSNKEDIRIHTRKYLGVLQMEKSVLISHGECVILTKRWIFSRILREKKMRMRI